MLTISPFGYSGGNQDTMRFLLDDGIAFTFCGADGTVYKLEKK